MPSKRTISRVCPSCGQLFLAIPTYILGHENNYCSRDCYHTAQRIPTQSVEERFWALVDKSGDCWLWQGGFFDNGYGAFYNNKQNHGAHRVAYELTHGPINDRKLFVCHACDLKSCVNPSHLWLGTSKDNIRDAMVKGRLATGERSGAYTHPEKLRRGDNHPFRKHPEIVPRGETHYNHLHPEITQGEKNGYAKLTEQNVREIRALYAQGVRLTELGRRYNVTVQAISLIVKRINWKHID